MIKEIKFTDNAIKQINHLLSKKEKGSFFRIAIKGGGCSGFQYGFTFDESFQDGDTEIIKKGVSLLIDPMSVQYLKGAEIDYKEDLSGSQFIIKNPNASTTCGCGSSFSVWFLLRINRS